MRSMSVEVEEESDIVLQTDRYRQTATERQGNGWDNRTNIGQASQHCEPLVSWPYQVLTITAKIMTKNSSQNWLLQAVKCVKQLQYTQQRWPRDSQRESG